MQQDTTQQRPKRGIVGAIKTDVVRLHESWMELVFPRQRHDRHPVLGKWKPRTGSGLFAYRLWAVLGAPIVVLGYPLLLFGLIVRFHARSMNRTVARIGLVGVVLLTSLVWGSLTVIARFQLDTDGFLAVGAAAAVAVVAAAIAVITHRVDGRTTTILFAYPAGVTAIFLPPVVAALFEPTIGDIVFPQSESLAIWLLDNLLALGGLDGWMRENFDLVGIGYVAMWIGISVPIGWLLGILVTLTHVIRPTSE